MKEELQNIENKQQDVTEIKKQQDISDCKSINKNSAETMLVCESSGNMLMIEIVDKIIMKSALVKYTKFVNKKYDKGDLIVCGSDEGHLLVYS